MIASVSVFVPRERSKRLTHRLRTLFCNDVCATEIDKPKPGADFRLLAKEERVLVHLGARERNIDGDDAVRCFGVVTARGC